MLTRLRIQNFKAWKDTGEIRLAPITVFFGSNSSGKTSIHQLLLMLKQTAQSPDRQRVLHPGDDKSMVDLGTIRDLMFGHDEKAGIAFEFAWRLPKPLTVTDPRVEPGKHKREHSGETIAFAAEVAQGNGKDAIPLVKYMSYTLGDPLSGGLAVRMIASDSEVGRYDLKSEGYDFVRNRGKPWPLPAPIRFYGFPDEVKVYYQNADFVADLALALERMLDQLYHVGPLRESPRRVYVWSGEKMDHVGVRGDRAVPALLAARGRKLSPAHKKQKQSFEPMIARWLKDMGLIESFTAKPLAEHRKEYEVLVSTAGSKHAVNLTDVGFGVSQVLPVVVECFYVPAASTIIFEQPEIHLHPSVQAALADLFIEAIHACEEGRPRGIQLIIESHSEHFLRRLQRRIAENGLKPEEAALYFCEPGPTGSILHALEVDLFGNISNWPDNFFGDEVGDLAAMTDAAMQRQSGGEG